MKLDRFRNYVATHQFAMFMVLVIAITILVTMIGLSVYLSSGTVKLDLSRPGYEKMRRDVQQSSTTTFSSSGPLDSSALKQFNKQLDDSTKGLNSASNFGGASGLSDQSLGL